MSASKLSAIFNAKSVAVIGASTKPGTVGNDLLKNLVAPKDGKPFLGEVYPINPKADEIFGKPVYKTIGEVPGSVDLAVLCLNAKFILDTIEQCKAKGVQGIVIISAGFKEVGKEGAELEKQVLQKSVKLVFRLSVPTVSALSILISISMLLLPPSPLS